MTRTAISPRLATRTLENMEGGGYPGVRSGGARRKERRGGTGPRCTGQNVPLAIPKRAPGTDRAHGGLNVPRVAAERTRGTFGPCEGEEGHQGGALAPAARPSADDVAVADVELALVVGLDAGWSTSPPAAARPPSATARGGSRAGA